MEQKFNLETLSVLNSMHDQRVHNVELDDSKFILYYNKLYQNMCNEYHTCDVIFSGVNEADIVAEVRQVNGLFVKCARYYDKDFLEFLNDRNYVLETIYFYHGYKAVIIEAALVDAEGNYREDCTIKISATKVFYNWN